MHSASPNKTALKRTPGTARLPQSLQSNPRAAFETSARLGLVRKALRQS